ncbi:lipopolysaccharide biosynthesis protein [Halalkalibacterium ligniniphilum]|uniref:lipopolysaccharide biosynthesis protein n=1 Tax=Halalkalibacterium ligniniphilum TaxID=1134413 RepID=UPI0003450828|nr:oligosaccharide flippase family protein [Halalkalibacterium ligniniphilum]
MLKKLLGNDFNRNVLTLLTGTSVAQAIPIAISPILTRLYTPEDFGVLALFIAITVIFGSIANGRYELAIVLPEKEEEAINLVALSIVISFLFSTGLFFIMILFHTPIVQLLGNNAISFWLYLAPLTVFFISLFNSLLYLNTRLKAFKKIAQVHIYKSIALAFIQLTLGIFKGGSSGLVMGQIASHLTANGKLFVYLLKNKKLLLKINKKEMIRMAKRYIRFPKFSMWATLANNLSQNINNIFISTFFSVSTLGSYFLVQRILGLPVSLIGTSISNVFYQRATEERNVTGNASTTFKSTLLKLAVISIMFFLPLYFVIEDLVTIVFGETWRNAGEYAKYLIPLMFIRFIAVPLSLTTMVFEKQNIDLSWQLGFLGWMGILFSMTVMYDLSITMFLMFYAILLSIHYIMIILITYRLALGNEGNK